MSFGTSLPPAVFRRVAKEVRNLVREPIEGVKLKVDDENLTDIQAEIYGPEDTPYEGGVFRIKLVLSDTFPAQPPKGFFLTPIFHPNVGPSGEICVNTLKRDWSADHKLKHILIVIRCLLIHPNPDSALNEEAGHLLRTDYQAFSNKAKLLTNIHARRVVPRTKSRGVNEPLANISSPNCRKRILKPVGVRSKKKKTNKLRRKGKSLKRL